MISIFSFSPLYAGDEIDTFIEDLRISVLQNRTEKANALIKWLGRKGASAPGRVIPVLLEVARKRSRTSNDNTELIRPIAEALHNIGREKSEPLLRKLIREEVNFINANIHKRGAKLYESVWLLEDIQNGFVDHFPGVVEEEMESLLEIEYSEKDILETITRLAQNHDDWFKDFDRFSDNGLFLGSWGAAISLLKNLFLLRSAEVCPITEDIHKEIFKLLPSVSGNGRRDPSFNYEVYRRQFLLGTCQALAETDPTISKQQLNVLRRILTPEEDTLGWALQNPTRVGAAGNSLMTTHAHASSILSMASGLPEWSYPDIRPRDLKDPDYYKNELQKALSVLKSAKRPDGGWDYSTGAGSNPKSSSPRGSAARGVVASLALYLVDRDEGGNRKPKRREELIKALKIFDNNLPFIMVHALRRPYLQDAHYGKDGLGIHYFYPTIPYVTAAIRILDDEKKPGESAMLEKFRDRSLRALFKLIQPDGYFRPLSTFVFASSSAYVNPLGGAALLAALKSCSSPGILSSGLSGIPSSPPTDWDTSEPSKEEPNKRTFSELMEDLKSSKDDEIMDAALELRQMAPTLSQSEVDEAEKIIINTLKKYNKKVLAERGGVETRLVEAWSAMGAKARPGMLKKIIFSDDPTAAGRALTMQGKDIIPLLISFLDNTQTVIKIPYGKAGNYKNTIAALLGDFGPDAAPAIPSLISVLSNSSSARDTLAMLGKVAIPGLLKELDSATSSGGRSAIFSVFGEMGPRAESALNKIIINMIKNGDELEITKNYEILLKISPNNALELLKKIQKDKENYTAPERVRAQIAIIMIKRKIGG
jgi:hypothetical protein